MEGSGLGPLPILIKYASSNEREEFLSKKDLFVIEGDGDVFMIAFALDESHFKFVAGLFPMELLDGENDVCIAFDILSIYAEYEPNYSLLKRPTHYLLTLPMRLPCSLQRYH